MGTVPTQTQEEADAAAAAAAEDSGSQGSAASSSSSSVPNSLSAISDEMAETPRPTQDSPVEERRAYKARMDVLSKKAASLRKDEIKNNGDLSDKEKDVLRLYDKGVHIFAIAKQVYEFANQDTVGRVSLIIRKAHATDFNEVEDVNSTKGYTGIGTSGNEQPA